MIRIREIRVLDPESRLDQVLDLELREGRIARMAEPGILEPGREGQEELLELDGRGLVCAPGLMDVHVHFREPGFTYKEDIFTGARAAAAGGFTRVVCMANTEPVADTPEILRSVLKRGEETGIHVLTCGALTKDLKGKELTDLEALKAAGAAGFTDDGKPLLDEGLVRRAMEAARKLGLPVSFHEEDPRLIAQNGIHRGEVSRKLGLSGSPHEAEDVLVERDCRLALETGCKVVIQHISSARSVELVRRAKEAGASVFAEATPHHFSLTQEAVLQYGSLAKMNPPLRTEEDRQALIRGLQDGTIDVIATDHAPHSREEKERPFTEAPSGIIGLETALALGITNLVRPGYLSLEELMRKMSVNPARLYGLETPGICPGAPADLVLFAEEEAWQVESFYSRASNSPFTGSTLYGRVHATICGGRIVYKLKEF
ncbi:MAG: dihydroorotase [Lachnospiraceae bacterium]|nr:dihydroorotase [Lachnospiraceae bacterium]